MPIRVGLFGAGRIGRVHAHSISGHAGSTLVAVSDVMEDAARRLAADFSCQVRTADAILADTDIDAILIASPTATHVKLIGAGIRAGKAIYCEKPVDLDLGRARACLAEAAGYGRPVMIGFNRRFDRSFSAVKTAFDDGEIGKGELLGITSFDPAPPPVSYIKGSGGLFRDMAIHDFDMACWLFGGVPETVSAHGSCLVDPEIGKAGDIDTAVTVLKFADGRLACIHNSRRAAYGYDQRLELLGEKGMLSVDNMPENLVRKSDAAGVHGAKPEYFFLERYMMSYRSGWAQFVDSIANGTPAPVSVQDGVNALAIAEAADISQRSGQPVALASVLEG